MRVSNIAVIRGGTGVPVRVTRYNSAKADKLLKKAPKKIVEIKQEVSFEQFKQAWNRDKDAFWDMAKNNKLDYYFTVDGLEELEKAGLREDIVKFLLQEKGSSGRAVLKAVADIEIENIFITMNKGIAGWIGRWATKKPFKGLKAQNLTFEQATEALATVNPLVRNMIVKQEPIGTINYIRNKASEKHLKNLWDSV